MEICFLYDYDNKESWEKFSSFGDHEEKSLSCGSSLRDAVRKLGNTATTFSLYSFNEQGTGMHRLIDSIRDGYSPDAIFLMHAGGLKHGLTDIWDRSNFNVRNKRIPMISEGGDEWQCFNYNFPHNSKSDLVLTCDNECSFAYNERGVNSEWFPVWADERVFFDDERNREIDISTTAVPTPVRNERGFLRINDALAEKFSGFVNPMRDRVSQGYIPIMENGDLFRSSKIVFQFSSSGEMTRRLVEGAACGAAVVADVLPKIRRVDSILPENDSIVYYSSIGDCIEKISYLLENDKVRNDMASSAKERILKKHTGLARAKDLCNHIENYFGGF